MVDNPHKFALYERNGRRPSRSAKESAKEEDGTSQHPMARMRLRKMSDEEKPLLLALRRCLEEEEEEVGDEQETTREENQGDRRPECCYFVLQENDPGEICWESFTFPELRNFLLILDREEAWYKRRIHEKYEIVQQTMQALIEQKRPSAEEELSGDKEVSSKI